MSDWGTSDTAATVGKPLFPPSGVQTYRCELAKGFVPFVDVEAATGDEAAAAALVGQGAETKVTTVYPAPQAKQREKLTAKAA